RRTDPQTIERGVECRARPCAAPTGRWCRLGSSQFDPSSAVLNADEIVVAADIRHLEQVLFERRAPTPVLQRVAQDVAVLGLHGSPMFGRSPAKPRDNVWIEISNDQLRHDSRYQ